MWPKIRSALFQGALCLSVGVSAVALEAPEPEPQAPLAQAGKAEKTRTPDQQLRYGEWLLQESAARALVEFDRFLKQFPGDVHRPRAYFGRGKALFALGRFLEAFDSVEKSFPERPEIRAVVERCALERVIAQQLMQVGAESLSGPDGKKETGFEAASRVFKALVYNDREGLYAAEALMGFGEAQMALEEPMLAARAYHQVIEEYPRHKLVPLAKVRAAKTMLLATPPGERQETDILLQAENFLKEAEDIRSGADKQLQTEWAEAQALVAERKAGRLIEQARFYLARRGQQRLKSAVYLYQRVLQEYPKSQAAAKARRKLDALGIKSPGEETK